MDASSDLSGEWPRFEKRVLDLSSTFIDLAAGEVDAAIGTALGRVALELSFDAATLIVLQDDGSNERCFAWSAESRDAAFMSVLGPDLPWSTERLSRGQAIEFNSVAELPHDAARDRTAYERQGVRSYCGVPISVGGRPIGLLSLASCAREIVLPHWLASGLRLVGEIFCGALLRARAAEASLDIDDLMTLMPAAGRFGVWELNADEEVRINDAARALLHLDGSVTGLAGLLRSAHDEDRENARRAITQALRCQQILELRYRVNAPDGRTCWIAARGRVDARPSGEKVRLRSVLVDVTELRRAQDELEQLRNELSHLNRVAMLSFLSGSFAHELKQPLTAILSNAQAGLRFLKASFVDRDELQEILADIVKEDERAGEVIRQLQALFRRGESVQRLVNLNEAAQEVIGLLHSDLVGRSVLANVALDQRLPMILGDRVQLQQVVLNLIVNACEAMSDNATDDRTFMVRTERVGFAAVRLSVTDNGRGIPPEDIERIFEPFFTTKPGGTGLGLVICRKIIGAHNGRLWAATGRAAGVTFSFELPAQG